MPPFSIVAAISRRRDSGSEGDPRRAQAELSSSSNVPSRLKTEALDSVGCVGVLAQRTLTNTIGQTPLCCLSGCRRAPQSFEPRSRSFFDQAAEVRTVTLEQGHLVEKRCALRRQRDHLAGMSRRHGAKCSTVLHRTVRRWSWLAEVVFVEAFHRLGALDQYLHLGQLALCERANLFVGGGSVVAGRKQRTGIVEGEAGALGDVDDREAAERLLGV